MVKKYKMVRVPVEAICGFENKRKKMERTVKSYTGKTVKIPLTKVMIAVANSPVEIHEQKVIRIAKKGVRRVKKCVAL